MFSFWDFGMGDLGVVVYAQVEWKPVQTQEMSRPVMVPHLYILDALESTDRTSSDWARIHQEFVQNRYGISPALVTNICDPAGRQRNISTGRSVIEDLYAAGVRVVPAPKRPIDYAIRILNNMMADDRVLVSVDAERVSAAFASHKWPMDPSGNRTGTNPVHDWTSHFVDAVRYGVSTLLSISPRKGPRQIKGASYRPDQWGYVTEQLLKPPADDYGLGADGDTSDIEWQPHSILV
jgi:hypothetical protein